MPGNTRSSGAGSAGPPKAPPSASVQQKGVFYKEGNDWTVGVGGKTVRLKESKGLAYLSYLLRHPVMEFHVLDLVGGIASSSDGDEVGRTAADSIRSDYELEKAGIHIGGLGDAGEVLDDTAKRAYRRRISELRQELEEAKALGKVNSAEQLEEEIDALMGELSRAVGLGGRDRRTASASERARQTVTKTIRMVVERIAQSDAGIGKILSRCIKTGTLCRYQPDPDLPIVWEFTAPPAGGSPTSRPGSVSVPSDEEQTSPAILGGVPFSTVRRTPFVGRETESSAVRSTIGRAQPGNGSVIMLSGGPGVGKTRLAIEIAEDAARNGFACFLGRCYERDEPPPYLPFVQIIEAMLDQSLSLDEFARMVGDTAPELAQLAPRLRRVFPHTPEPTELPRSQKRLYLFQSVAEALQRAARTRPQLLILDDLHWADESTLALLNHLANRLARHAVVIIGTYRDEYLEHPVLARTIEELIKLGVRPLKLSGLSRDSVAKMLEQMSERQVPESLVNTIFTETNGNPFFIEEVYRYLVEERRIFDSAGAFLTGLKIDEIEVPENVRLCIIRRLDRLSENEMRMLSAAAIFGRSFSFQLLAAISEAEIDELFAVIEKAQRMAIIVPSAEGPERPFTFSHELVRQTLLAEISIARRQQLHAKAARAVESVCPTSAKEYAGEIADHLLKAGSFADRNALIHWLIEAGNAALEASAFDEARANFESALSYRSAVDPRARADLLASLAMAEQGLERWNAVFANLREALDIYVNLGDRDMVGRSFTELTDAFISAGNFQEAAETARRGLAYLEADVSANRGHLLASLGHALAAAATGYKPANEALREALNIASQLSDQRLEARVLGSRSLVNLNFFRLKECAEDGLLSEQLGGSETPLWQHAQQLRILLQALLCLGRPEEALRIADELEPLAKKIGQSFAVAFCRSTRAWVEFGKAPELAKLETGFRQVSQLDQKVWAPFWEVVSHVQLSLVDHVCGNWAGALSHAQVASRADPRASSIHGFPEGTLFRQMAYAGDRAGATAILHENRALLAVSGQQNIRGSWWMLALVIEGLVMLGQQSQAGQLYPLARELIGTGAVTLWPIFRFTHTIAGIAAAAARQWDAAEEHFQIAIQQAESFPYRLEQAELRRFHAMMLLDRSAAGDRAKARRLLREALPSYTQIGMPRHIEMTGALLERAASQ